MKVVVLSPTITLIKEVSEAEKSKLQALSSFKNTSVGYLIKQHQGKSWLKKNKPDVWNAIQRDLSAKYEGTILERKGDIVITKTGHLPYLMNEMDIEVVENRIVYPEPKSIPFKKPLPFELYPYQEEAVEKLIKEKHGNAELSVGLGKTAILMTLVQRMGLRAVIGVPSRAIFYEVLEKCQEHFGIDNVGYLGDSKKKIGKRVMVCISKSLSLLKKGTPEYEDISTRDVMAIDEAHCWASETLDSTTSGVFRDIPYRFFVTGTLTRGDGTLKILESIVGKTVIEMETKEGIAKGFLCPLEFTIVETYSPSKMSYKDPGKMRRVHFLNNTEIARIIAKIANEAGQRGEGTLVLVEEMSQIPLLAKLLTVPYGIAHGNSTSKEDQEKNGLVKCDVKKEIEDFNLGKTKVLIGSSTIQTGCNIFPTHNCCNWLGGASEIDQKQGPIGRCVRILGITKYAQYHAPKPVANIYDFKVLEQESSLKKRTSFYKQTGGKISVIRI